MSSDARGYEAGYGYIAKVFKSGNSLALRLPKVLGFADGQEVAIVPHADGSFSLVLEADKRAAFMQLFGSMSPEFMRDGPDDTEQAERDWTPAGGHSAAA